MKHRLLPKLIPFNYAVMYSLFCCLLHFNAQAQQHDQVITVVTEDAAPLQYMQNGTVAGMTTDIVRNVFSTANISAEIKIYPWARALQIVKEKPDTFIYSLIRSEERESEFQWVGKIITFKLAMLAFDDDSIPSITNISDAKSYRLGVLRNDFTHSLLLEQGFKANVDFELFSDLPHLLRLLYADKIDAFIADLVLTRQMAEILSLSPEKLISVYDMPELQVPVYLAANKHSDPVLIKKLQDSLKLLKANVQ